MTKFFALASVVFGFVLAACTFNTNNSFEIVVPSDNTAPPAVAGSATPSASTNSATTIFNPPPVKATPGTARIIDYDVEGHPSRIVISGSDVWERFTGYMLCAGSEEDVSLSSIGMAHGGHGGFVDENADFAAVGISLYGKVIGAAMFPSGLGPSVKIALTTNVVALKGTCTPFEFVAKIASNAVSGHGPSLRISGTKLGNLEADIKGLQSGTKISARSDGTGVGLPMIIRKSMPIVTVLPLSSSTLSNGLDMDFIKLQVGANSAGSIAWKKLDVIISKSADLCISNVKVRRGSTDLDPSMYTFSSSSSVSAGSDHAFLKFQFADGIESVETGSGSVYTFHGTMCGVSAGSSLTTSLSPTDYTHGTSGLAVDASGEYTVAIFDTGTFIWSDLSAAPHSAHLLSKGGSADWTNSNLIDLDGVVTLK